MNDNNVSNFSRGYENEGMYNAFQRPAVIDMSDVKEESDYKEPENTKFNSNVLLSRLTSTVWAEGKEKAETLYKSYATVDFLRPYFDVEPKEVLNRLIHSFIPININNKEISIPSELYGPVMICLTLIALLLYEMKSSGTVIQEGTLMGTALLTCFGYWMIASSIMWVIAYVGNTQLRPVQINTIMGYALTGPCIVVMLGSLIHVGNSHAAFYLIWVLFGGLTSARVATIFCSRTSGNVERIVAAVVCCILQMGFLLYLHFAYHLVVSGVAQAIQKI